MKKILMIWILGMLFLINTVYAITAEEISTNPWSTFLIVGGIFYGLIVGLMIWLKKKISKTTHIMAAVIGVIMGIAAVESDFYLLDIFLGAGLWIWTLIKYLISSWIGVIILCLFILFIVGLSKGWFKLGKPWLIVIGSIVLFCVIAWFYYKGDIQILKDKTFEVGFGRGDVEEGERSYSTGAAKGLTKEIVDLIKKYGRNDPCYTYAIMWQEVGRLRGVRRWSPYAISPAGAAGLMQIIPPTAIRDGKLSASRVYESNKYNAQYDKWNSRPRQLTKGQWKAYKKSYYNKLFDARAKKIKDARNRGTSKRAAVISLDTRFDPEVSVRTGSNLLFSLRSSYGSVKLAAMVYNGGGEAARLYKQKGDRGLTGGFRETKNYYKDVVKKYDACKKAKSLNEFLKSEGYKPGTGVIKPIKPPAPTTAPTGGSTSEEDQGDDEGSSSGSNSLFPD